MAGTLCDNNVIVPFLQSNSNQEQFNAEKLRSRSPELLVSLLVWARPSAIALLYATIGADPSHHFY